MNYLTWIVITEISAIILMIAGTIWFLAYRRGYQKAYDEMLEERRRQQTNNLWMGLLGDDDEPGND